MNELISHEWKVKIAIGLIIGFLILSALLFITTLIVKLSRAYLSIRNTRFKNKIENHLNEILADFEEFSQEDIDEVKNNLKKFTYAKWQKLILTDTLIYYNQNLSGNVKEFIRSLFYEMGLQILCLKGLNKRSIRSKVQAMRYLSAIRYEEAWVQIISYINHKRKLIRVEASLALIFLTKNPLFFMDNLKFPLTQWQKINIYKKLQELPAEKIPKFDRWFMSSNISVRKFAIEMSARFNQTELLGQLSLMLKNNPEEVKIEIVATLLDSEAFEYIEPIKAELQGAKTEKLKEVIIRAIGQLSSDEQDANLLKPYLQDPSLNIRKETAKALKKMENGDAILQESIASTPDMERILLHISNPLLT